MLKRPKGGLWLELNKLPTAQRPIDELKAPAKLYLPVKQHKGELSVLAVAKGDHVYKGQVIASGSDGVSCPLHSPVSGVVEDIDEYISQTGIKSDLIIIANDGLETLYPRFSNLSKKPTQEEILESVKLSGAVSADNEALPLWAKLKTMFDIKPKTIIVNAVETEPYICMSQKIIDETPDDVTTALSLIMNATGAVKVIVAISDDVPHEIANSFDENVNLAGLDVSVAHIPQKYPNGNERFLMRQIFGRKMAKLSKEQIEPNAENLHIGFLMPQDCLNIKLACSDGLPQTTRIITVAGDAVKNPQNLEVRIGTTVRDVLERCGLSYDPDRIVLGSAMRGVSVTSLDTPITKSVCAVLALKAVRGGLQKSICVNCGKCVSVCPQGLMPNYIAMRAVKADFDSLKELHISDCIECGSCAYICPGRMPIVELIKNIKKAAL